MRNRRSRQRLALRVEVLESRVVLSSLTIALGNADQFGPQIPTVQAYGGATRVAYDGILDTGASPITFSASDQAGFYPPIPILGVGSAQATGIGGTVQGDVSQPGTILVDGVHALSTFYDQMGFQQYAAVAFGAQVPGIQAFIGTADGSPGMPTVTGTSVFNPSSINPQGLAALVNMVYQMSGSTSFEPDVHFVSPSTVLPSSRTTVTIPLSLFGPDNYSAPGNQVTVSPVPVDLSVSVNANSRTVAHQEFLFDTGSQLTIISPEVATSLHLNLAHPTTTIQIQGVGGTVTVPGFTLHSLSVPVTGGGSLTFTNVPVYVLNAGSGFDGVLGMNLLDHATSMLYNPYGQGGASLSVTFNTATPVATPLIGNRLNGAYPGQLQSPNQAISPNGGHVKMIPRGFLVTVSLGTLPGSAGTFSGSQGNPYLFVTLQTQALPAGPGTGADLLPANSLRTETIGLTPGYGAIVISDVMPESSTTPSQPGSPAQQPNSAPQLPSAPAEQRTVPTPSSSDVRLEAVTAFFAAQSGSQADDETPALDSEGEGVGEALAKLAVVVAGFWGSIPKETDRNRQRFTRPVSSRGA